MRPITINNHIIWLDQVDSTNDEALRRINSLDNMSVIAAVCQSAGRGQGDHSWYSPEGESLTCTFVVKCELECADAICLSCVAALGVSDYLERLGISSRIKWPNDIWVGDRKICGLLIQNSVISGKITNSIIGIGLNVNCTRWPEDLPNPVSIKELTGNTTDIAECLTELHADICRRAALLSDRNGRMSLQEEFEKKLFTLREEL